MKIASIALEEQYISSNAFTAAPPELKKNFETFRHPWYEKLSDLSPDGPRLQAMDSGDMTVAVLSNVPGVSSFEPQAVTKGNDELAAAVESQPRYRGFASLPMKHPQVAASELERCVKKLGFVGALIDSHTSDGSYYDDSKFWPVFAKAEELDVPIYIHPTFPTEIVQNHLFNGNYSEDAGRILGIAGWGWHSDTGLAVLRMFCAGLFDKFPGLKIIIGHSGEMLPFMLTRLDKKLREFWREARKGFREVWDSNIWVSTSGMFDLAPMACLVKTTKIERILYSVDYPWSGTEEGKSFLLQLSESGIVSPEELEKIAFKNAEKLLKFTI